MINLSGFISLLISDLLILFVSDQRRPDVPASEDESRIGLRNFALDRSNVWGICAVPSSLLPICEKELLLLTIA